MKGSLMLTTVTGRVIAALLVPVATVMARLIHGDYGRGEDA